MNYMQELAAHSVLKMPPDVLDMDVDDGPYVTGGDHR